MLNKISKVYFIFLAFLVLMAACDKNEVNEPEVQAKPEYVVSNLDPSVLEPLPEITFDFSDVLKAAAVPMIDESCLDPAEFQATLWAGESVVEAKFAHLASAPPVGDIMMSFDLTGSMYFEIGQAKANAISIIGGVRGIIPDSYFGVMSHMDYNGYYDYCGYDNTYGSGTDYPYSLDQALTLNATDVGNAISALALGHGEDGYENYTRILYESYADMNIGWRDGSKKILLAWLDNYPHDCDIDLGWGVTTSGVDPGRDAVAGTVDDLDFDDVLLEMEANNITPIVISCDGSFAFWQTQMQSIGGDAYELDAGDDIAELVAEIIATEVTFLEEVKLEACDPAYADWVSSSPAFYGVDLTDGADLEFDVTITPPEGTEPGIYEFDICLLGDGAEYARQHVSITVIKEVPLDIHPTSCPNPLNTKAGGVLPVALLGTPDIDVSEIDPASIRLEGVAPLRWSLEDVATPYVSFGDELLDAYACNELEMDGLMDLAIKFDLREVVVALKMKYGSLERGQVLILTITGEFKDGISFVGDDVMIVVK